MTLNSSLEFLISYTEHRDSQKCSFFSFKPGNKKTILHLVIWGVTKKENPQIRSQKLNYRVPSLTKYFYFLQAIFYIFLILLPYLLVPKALLAVAAAEIPVLHGIVKPELYWIVCALVPKAYYFVTYIFTNLSKK